MYRELNHHPILYAEMCPEEPQLFQPFSNDESEQLIKPRKKHKKVKIKFSSSDYFYSPKIIRSRKPLRGLSLNSFQQSQHMRELQSLNRRILDCKNRQQRIKDHSDPIVYPSYFIRAPTKSKDARIDGYFKKVLAKQYIDKHQKQNKSRNYRVKDSSLDDTEFDQIRKDNTPIIKPKLNSFQNHQGNDNFSGKKLINLQIGNNNFRIGSPMKQNRGRVFNLPKCGFQEIINYIISRNIIVLQDIRILCSRLKHHYGVENVQKQWPYVESFLNAKFK